MRSPCSAHPGFVWSAARWSLLRSSAVRRLAGRATWLTVPRANYLHRNSESFTYLLAEYTPLDWTGGTWFARALVAAILLGAFAFIPLRRFDNAVRVAAVVVLAISMSLAFHSPHWNLWFMFLLCLIPISLPLFLLLVVYDINTLLYWPLFSYATPIEVLRPLAREVAVYPIVVQCALKFALIVWLLRDAWRVGVLDGKGAEAQRGIGSNTPSSLRV